jgi:hypothetical protein
MSQSYNKPCMFCKQEIVMSDRTSGNWLPYNLNGSIHECKSTGTKKVETKELTLEERVKRLESIVIDPRK